MPSYRNCACAICFQPLNRPQNTCGAPECLDAWKHLNRDARRRHKNLASCPPSERALILAQGPTPDELEAQAANQAMLDEQLAEYQQQQQKKNAVPQFLRSALAPENAPIKPEGGDLNEANELPRKTPETPTGS